jgi:hypothetical protein
MEEIKIDHTPRIAAKVGVGSLNVVYEMIVIERLHSPYHLGIKYGKKRA